jgi:hypothetical protein
VINSSSNSFKEQKHKGNFPCLAYNLTWDAWPWDLGPCPPPPTPLPPGRACRRGPQETKGASSSSAHHPGDQRTRGRDQLTRTMAAERQPGEGEAGLPGTGRALQRSETETLLPHSQGGSRLRLCRDLAQPRPRAASHPAQPDADSHGLQPQPAVPAPRAAGRVRPLGAQEAGDILPEPGLGGRRVHRARGGPRRPGHLPGGVQRQDR